MNLIQESYQRLFPEKEFPFKAELEYNRRLSPFNANISLRRDKINLHLNLQWKDIDNEIKIGLIQSLLVKILREKKNSPNIDLYNNFIKNIPILTPKDNIDPILEQSFQRLNQQFFSNELEKPNLTWGTSSFHKLASYNFHNDTVTMSTIFQDAKEEVVDYVMYHELLHKHHKFNHKNGRSSFHTRAFRTDEHSYPNHEQIERQINGIIRSKKYPIKKKLWGLWMD